MSETATAPDMKYDIIPIEALHHISVPVRDRAEAIRFWSSTLGADYVEGSEDENFSLIRLSGGVHLGLSLQPGGWTARRAEYPHYAFRISPDHIEAFKQRLDDLGVPNHGIWTRFKKEVLIYFRDPSGNLYELVCPAGYAKAGSVPVGNFYGGTFTNDFDALNYDNWNDPGA